jgi:hypothetical protein
MQTASPTVQYFSFPGAHSPRQDIHLDMARHEDPKATLEGARGEPLSLVEIKRLPIRETYERLHSGLHPDTFIAWGVAYANMAGISQSGEMDFALGAEIQSDPMLLMPPAPDLPSMKELGHEIRIAQRTTTGWTIWRYFPERDVWLDLEMNRVTPPAEVREAAIAEARKRSLP